MRVAIHRWVRSGHGRSRVGRVAARALVLVALVAGVLVGSTTAAGALGTLSGTVTAAEDGAPLGGIAVSAHDPVYGVQLGATTTAPDGSFALDLAPRTYKVRFVDPSGTRPSRWSGGARSHPTATPVVVTDGGSATSDVALARRARVHGTVIDAADAPLGGIQVALVNQFHLAVLTTVSAADGTWAIDGVPEGPWLVRFVDPAAVHATVFWPTARTA